MRKPFHCNRLPAFFLLLILLFPCCRGAPAAKSGRRSPAVPAAGGEGVPSTPREDTLPPEEESRPSLPVFEASPGVGVFTSDPRDPAWELEEEEREEISRSFRKAYAEALGRGLPLEGILGGDRVHAWPADTPLAWVQNWRIAEAYPNSWGLPNLVLAIRGFEAGEVFIVRGPILDAYGKSRGRSGANGVAGYGPPLGEEFPYGAGADQGMAQGLAQRFGEGLIATDASGEAAFIPREP
jgi:hypothetical protein